MTSLRPAIEASRDALRQLLEPGLIGLFEHIELTEIIGTPKGGPTRNVLSVAVLSEGQPSIGDAEQTNYLTERFRVDGFKGWVFGVARTLRPVTALDVALANLAATGEWNLSGNKLDVGTLVPEPAMFAPPDGTVHVPLNKVLKNNFWAGSHVVRLVDQEKELFKPFFVDRRRLQELSDIVARAVPMSIAGLADLLGDILIQAPVTVMLPSLSAPRTGFQTDVAIDWRPGTPSRALTIAGRTRWDELLTGAATSERFKHLTSLELDGQREPVETEMWDAEAGILLSATASTSTLKRIQFGMHRREHEPRLFNAPEIDGQRKPQRVKLISTRNSVIGEPAGQDANYWLVRRQDLEEKLRLEETREFVQYRPEHGSSEVKAKALSDIRFLINQHGESGVDLWDPYLCADDLLRTLFWSKHSGSPLRALTDGREPQPKRQSAPPPSAAAPKLSFAYRQKLNLDRDCGNKQGLKLEYRTRRGPKGWEFHDRFLIFPNRTGGPLAWSLGTSVNSLGAAHHILQRVSNSALVAGAFEDLWASLDEPQHVVWKST